MRVIYDPSTDVMYVEVERGSGHFTPTNSHKRGACRGDHCILHKPHPITDEGFNAPLNWREDRGIMERVCKHGVGHTVIEEYIGREDWRGVHGCCGYGCCAGWYGSGE